MIRALVLMGTLLLPAAVRADTSSTGFLTIAAQGQTVTVQWMLAMLDLDDAIGLDADGDGRITWGEARGAAGRIAAYAQPRLRIASDGALCPAGEASLLFDRPSGVPSAVLRYELRCPRTIGQLDIAYAALFETNSRHRGLVGVTLNGTEHAAVLSPDQPEARFGEAADAGTVARQFFGAGMAHMLEGADHLLFIVMLLVPTLLRPEEAGGMWRRLAATVGLLTAFTLAHATTLTLAVLGLVAIPPEIVEPAIAATILIAAADNVRPFLPVPRGALAFGFGLIHGFAVAGGLGPLALPPLLLALALLAFNLGLEAAQALVALLAAPFAFGLNSRPVASSHLATTLSVASAVVAAIWLSQRLPS